MSAAPAVINPQTVAVVGQRWDGLSSVRQTVDKRPFSSHFVSVDASSSGDEVTMKVRKPYTITKQRERWTESEHQKFLEALKLYGRAWRRIEEYIGTKTAVQIRSHAQKFFSKLEREATMGSSSGKVHDIEIPPPRPKRKPSHPYPKKAGNSTLSMGDQNKDSSPLPSVCTAVHQDLAQPSSFLPFNGKGGYRPGAAVPFHQGLSGRLGHLFRPQGSMKLFGKTVLVPKTLKPASQNVLAKESFALEGFPCIKTWPPTNEAALMQSDGFGPFSEVEKKLGYSIPGASFSRAAGFRSGVEKNEEIGESNMEAVSGDGLGAAAESGHGDCHLFNKGKSQSGKCEDYTTQSNSEDLGAVTQKADDGQLPYAAHHGSSMYPGMEDFLLCRNDIPFPAPSHGGTMATNTLAYWQVLQASAVNYAAYTAALAAAAAAAAGWTGPVGDGKKVADSAGLVSDGETQQAPLGNAHSFSLASGATTWCPFVGFLPPPGFCPPSGALQQKGRFLGSATDEQVLGYGCLKRPETDNEEGLPESETGDEAETRTPDLKPKLEENKECGESGIRGGYMLVGSSCATKTLGSEVALGCPKCPEATKMLMNCSTQESDTERLATEGGISQQDAYSSSSDDCEGGGKKQREGSSSGSNTPASRYHTSEFEAPNESRSRKRDCCTFENSDDTGCGLLEKSYQACHDKKVSVDPPKMRLKHLEKGRKLHQQRESRDSGCDSFKRFRSSAHDVESRKEVSEEGRKAFEALFTCKLLPQTFSATHMVCKDVSIGTGRECNTTSLSLMENSNEEISIVENPKGTAVAVSGMVASFSGSMLEVAIKPFTVSSSSGFVPYRKPSCMVPSKMNVPSS